MEVKINKDSYPPRKLSKERIDAILKDVAEGSTKKHAAFANGISEKIFYNWISQGKLEVDNDIESLYTYLVQSMAKIEMKEIKLCRKLIASSDKSHKGAEWTLERAYWREFSSNAADIETNERLDRIEEDMRKNNDKG